MSLFKVGGYYPPEEHQARIKRYRDNKQLFLGNHGEVFERVTQALKDRHDIGVVYLAVNLPGIICKKSADFLFGETPHFSAGKDDDSKEQKAIERFIETDHLNTINYESALSNAYRGDSFYKIRWGQDYNGFLEEDLDPYRVIIEAQNAEYVFPETVRGNANKILAYHIAVPIAYEVDGGDTWVLNVESHYPGLIKYRKFALEPLSMEQNNIVEWKIVEEIEDDREDVKTNVPFPLVVHIPNYATDDSWEGIDDISEHKAIFDEISNRLSQIAVILDKHADPALVVPSGTLQIGENGEPEFRVAVDKVFEVESKEDIIPQYITWNGHLDAAFKEIEKLIDLLLTTAEMPPVSLGRDNSGTSGSSGASIKFRLSTLLAKINRKRQYYDRGLKQVLLIAQLLELAQTGRKDYEVTTPKITFKDGLPDDEMEIATVTQIRTGGKPTLSQKTALMTIYSMTEEQADIELERIRKEDSFVDASIFQTDVVEDVE